MRPGGDKGGVPTWRLPTPRTGSEGMRLECSGKKNVGRAGIDTAVLPHAVMGYVVRFTGRHQIGLALLSICVFLLSTAPLELQRRIVNDAIKKGMTETVLWLALLY